MPKQNWKEWWLHNAFLVTVILKGVDGLLEIGLGLLLMFTDEFSDAVFVLIRSGLVDDPNGYFGSHLRALANQSHEAFLIGGIYLVVHGAVKVFISGTLWRDYAWAYPAALALLGLFIFYELIHVLHSGSIPYMCLALFDIVMFALVGYEYKYRQH